MLLPYWIIVGSLIAVSTCASALLEGRQVQLLE